MTIENFDLIDIHAVDEDFDDLDAALDDLLRDLAATSDTGGPDTNNLFS